MREGSDHVSESSLPDLIGDAAAKCEAVNVAWERSEKSSVLFVKLPNGRATRTVRVSRNNVRQFLSVDLDAVSALGVYDGLVNRKTGAIETNITVGRGRIDLWRLPGAEILDRGYAESYRPPRSWHLRVESDDVRIELSPNSTDLQILGRIARDDIISLKISGLSFETQAKSIESLETYGMAFLFDLNVRYGAGVNLRRLRKYTPRPEASYSAQPPRFPENKYAADALSLYSYADTSGDFPLLEFLAYYQVLEYFFPVFTRNQQIERVRSIIKNPRFDWNDDVQIGKVVALLDSGSRGGVSERDQLRATISGCTTVEDLEAFIRSDDAVWDHFTSKKQSIGGAPTLNPRDANYLLTDQVSDRLYKIRCRVVHTKHDGGDSGVELLLPSSEEAQFLTYDIELLRTIAQAAIVRCSSPL